MNWLDKPISEISEHAIQAANDRQLKLTKPPGSLGKLEELAIMFSAVQKHSSLKLKTYMSLFLQPTMVLQMKMFQHFLKSLLPRWLKIFPAVVQLLVC